MHFRQPSVPFVPLFIRRRRRGIMNLMMSNRYVLVCITLLVMLGFFWLPSQPITALKPSFGSSTTSPQKLQITTKVATITDTTFSPRHIPLIMHFSGVLGPEWPIVFYTSQQNYEENLKPGSANVSAIWTRALDQGRVQVRFIPERFDLTSRNGVNHYLADRWMWQDLAPAKHVLVFQADAIICANSYKSVDDFLEWDFIGATLSPDGGIYNGGLSLRNREATMKIVTKHSYIEDSKTGEFKNGGEDEWFSKLMRIEGGNLPSNEVALDFACEYHFHIRAQKRPMGYHKIHKAAPSKIDEIAEWCPEIALTAPGKLGKS